MDDLLLVGVVKRVGHLLENHDCFVERQPLALLQHFLQRAPFQELHCVPEKLASGRNPVDGNDVGMIQGRGGLRFPLEAFDAVAERQLRRQHLDGHLAVQGQLVGEVHHRHSAAAERTPNLKLADGVLPQQLLHVLQAGGVDGRAGAGLALGVGHQ